MARCDLTPEVLRETLTYNPDTGLFTWVKGGHGRRVGEQAGGVNPSNRYVYVRCCGIRYSVHRLAWFFMLGEWPKYEIDHINGIRSDNRFCNLRDVTKNVNMQNQRHAQADNKSSGLLGVRRSSHTHGKWLAEIKVNGKRKHIGVFFNPEDAHAAYVEEKKKIHMGCSI